MEILNLKTLFALSLGLHLLLFSLAAIFWANVRIDPLRTPYVEVSLLPPVLLPMAEEKAFIKPQVKTEEKRTPQEAKQEAQREDPVVKTVLEPERPLPPQAAAQSERVIHPQPPPMTREEEKTGATLSPEMVSASQSPTKKDNIMIAMVQPSAQESPGVRLPIVPSISSESSVSLLKSPPPSEERIVFARPKYGENPKPVYPAEARKRGYHGEVILKVEVLSNGRVGQIELKRSSGHEILDRSALAAVKQWRFIPAKEGENIISVWVNIPVKFQLQ